MSFQSLFHHALVPLFFTSFVFAATQPPLPSLPPPPLSADSSPTVPLPIVFVVTGLFLVIFFSVYIVQCTGVPINPAGMSSHGVSAPNGLDVEVIGFFPTFVYSEVKEHKIGKGGLECAVCISEFKDYEILRLIPGCDHVFHLECIDEWLSGHVTCPVCRANLIPPSRDSVKGRAADSVQEVQDHVEIEIRGPTIPTDDSMRGRGGVLNMNSASESQSGEKWRRLGRSHPTGNSLVRSGDDVERFTLRLPDEVRKQIME